MTPHSQAHSDRPVLVSGATGAIGREVVRALLERNAPVRVFVRSPEKVAHLPEQVERAAGTFGDPDAIARALAGTRAAFFVSPHDDAEEQNAENFVSACERERIRLVFAGVHADGGSRIARALGRATLRLFLPPYAAKLRIAERIRTSRTEPVVLIPANYYQNDELCREQILAGSYPLPHRLAPRVDTRDVGDAAARALLDPTVPTGGYALVGPASMSGEDTAASWSAALGREVRYAPDIDLTDRLLDEGYGGRKAEDFRKTYRLLAKMAIRTRPSQVAEAASLLGRQPRTHAEYARDAAAGWESGHPAEAGVLSPDPGPSEG